MRKLFLILITLALLLMSCADKDVNFESQIVPSRSFTDAKDIFDPEEIDLIATPKSTCFSEIGYDEWSETLVVVFRDSGSMYIYKDFPKDEWEIFRVQRSIGGWYNKHIKGQYECERIY